MLGNIFLCTNARKCDVPQTHGHLFAVHSHNQLIDGCAFAFWDGHCIRGYQRVHCLPLLILGNVHHRLRERLLLVGQLEYQSSSLIVDYSHQLAVDNSGCFIQVVRDHHWNSFVWVEGLEVVIEWYIDGLFIRETPFEENTIDPCSRFSRHSEATLYRSKLLLVVFSWQRNWR